jgi:adenine-specific DNA-methyltransferase
MTKEEQFYQALEGIFVGVPVEGESGYINLMRIKSRYYQDGVFPQLQKDIAEALGPFPDFRDELFLKLYTFFKRYFSKSGSIYFDSTPADQNVYEKVYTDDRDVMLFWKTHMLYYVKTDRLFKPLDTEIGGLKFRFDVSGLEHKKANEKREIAYEFKEIEDGVIIFNVHYSEKGRKTGPDEILKALAKAKVKITEDTLEKAFRIFEKQSEVDYFINKNARAFLREQFDLWLYQYVFSGESQWAEIRIKQLQVLKDIAYKVIDFISQFEDELARIWNKPKFALNSNYVITLDRIADRDMNLVGALTKHPGFDEQVAEWKQLGILNDAFDKASLVAGGRKPQALNPKCAHLPVDTKYFKDLEPNIIGLFDDLDNALDGRLIKSESYQALNTILPKFEERVQAIYIDPPFNKEQDADYFYSVKYKDATWMTILENRLPLGRDLLKDTGSIFVRCDYNGNMYVRLLLNEVFGKDKFGSEIVVNRFKRQLGELTKLNVATDSLFYYGKSQDTLFKGDYRKRICTFCGQEIQPDWRPMSSPGLRKPPQRTILGKEYLPPKGRHWTFSQRKIDQMEKEGRIRVNPEISYTDLGGNKIKGLPEYLQTAETPVDSNWTDLRGYAFAATFPTRNAEELLGRSIKICTDNGDLVVDFFLGSGTTAAVAHKCGRRWIGIEMAEHFYTEALPRMKRVLGGDKGEISTETKWQGGGFFKYYELEQYEDTLRKVRYEDSERFDALSQDPYSQYIFLRDLKMLEALEVDYKDNKVNVDLDKLYPNMDIPETLSNLLGRYIMKIKPKEVEFEDGEKIDLSNLDYKSIKSLIWW